MDNNTPQNPPIPPVNTTITVDGQAPQQSIASAPIATQLTPPANVAPLQSKSVPPTAPLTPASRPSGWQNFRRGMESTTPQYSADASGKMTRTNPAPITKGGILGAILGGALQAVSAAASAQAPPGAKGYGAAASAGAQAAYERRISEDDRARQIAQVNLKNQQAVKAAAMENGLRAVQTAQITQQMQHDDVDFKEKLKQAGIKDESDQLALIKNRQDLADTIGTAQAWIANNGGPKPIDTIGHETGAAHKLHGQAAPHAKAIMQNKVTIVPNGQIGKGNGMLVFSTEDLSKPVPLGTPDLILPEYTGTINSNGSLPTTDTVIRADGKLTYGDVLARIHGQMAMQQQLQQRYITTIAAQSKANLENAQGRLANVEAENIKNLGLNIPQGFTTPPNAFVMSQNELQQTLTAQGVPLPADFATLYGVAHYDIDLKAYPSRVIKGTGQKSEAQAVAQIRTLINPNFNEQTYSGIKKQVDEYASTRLGTAGGNIIAFNTATAHLGKLYEAAQALNGGLQNPSNLRVWNTIVNQYGLQTGATPKTVFDTIQNALVGEVGKTYEGGKPDVGTVERLRDTFNSSASPAQIASFAKTTAQLMQSKNAQLAQQFFQWTGHLNPNAINPETEKTYKMLGLDPYAGLPQGAQAPVGATANQNPAQVPQFVPAKVQPPRPANVPANAVYGSIGGQSGWQY